MPILFSLCSLVNQIALATQAGSVGIASSPRPGRVFLAKTGRARYQGQAFPAPLLNAPHGSPQ